MNTEEKQCVLAEAIGAAIDVANNTLRLNPREIAETLASLTASAAVICTRPPAQGVSHICDLFLQSVVNQCAHHQIDTSEFLALSVDRSGMQ